MKTSARTVTIPPTDVDVASSGGWFSIAAKENPTAARLRRLISEIYPNRVRGRAIAVATAVNWFSAFLVAQFFLSVVDAIGEATTFFVFSALCVVTYVFVWRWVPETKGRSLEEIQERWVLQGDRMLEGHA